MAIEGSKQIENGPTDHNVVVNGREKTDDNHWNSNSSHDLIKLFKLVIEERGGGLKEPTGAYCQQCSGPSEVYWPRLCSEINWMKFSSLKKRKGKINLTKWLGIQCRRWGTSRWPRTLRLHFYSKCKEIAIHFQYRLRTGTMFFF